MLGLNRQLRVVELLTKLGDLLAAALIRILQPCLNPSLQPLGLHSIYLDHLTGIVVLLVGSTFGVHLRYLIDEIKDPNLEVVRSFLKLVEAYADV